jgi:hypothetical protein
MRPNNYTAVFKGFLMKPTKTLPEIQVLRGLLQENFCISSRKPQKFCRYFSTNSFWRGLGDMIKRSYCA